TDGGELAFVPAPLDPRGERLMFYGFGAPAGVLPFVPRGGIVIDVGAHLGGWAGPLAKAVGSTGQGFCVETYPLVAGPLARAATLRINTLMQAEVLKVALSAADGAGHLAVIADDSGLSRLAADADGTVAVLLRSLDSIVSEQGLTRLDLVKIDVEGHERQV